MIAACHDFEAVQETEIWLGDQFAVLHFRYAELAKHFIIFIPTKPGVATFVEIKNRIDTNAKIRLKKI